MRPRLGSRASRKAVVRHRSADTAASVRYNVPMMSRRREETRAGLEPGPAPAMAMRHINLTIVAGVILAGSLAVVLTAGNSFLSELGFAIASGSLVAAFAMATFFAPPITALIG